MNVDNSKPKGVYFKNLNAIRFIAAFVVIIHHVEQYKFLFKIENYWSNQSIVKIGKLGVILFFVLSGFLITYLLFKEKEVTKTIKIKKFYIRRILRIWPLYFLIVFLAFFVIPNLAFFEFNNLQAYSNWSDLIKKIFLFSFFLPNLVLLMYGAVPFASHLWSVGVEEQFYILWPVLNKYIKNKLFVIIGVILGYIGLKYFFSFFSTSNSYFQGLKILISSTPIDCMAIGGFFALLVYDESNIYLKIKKFIYSKVVQILVLITVLLLIYFAVSIPYIHNEVYSLLFGVLICNFATNRDVIFSLENKYTNFLGKISYGLYMYHPIIIFIVIKLSIFFNIKNNFVIYTVVFLSTIFISSLSYSFFEKKFIVMKIKYTDILSGDNAKSLN